MRFVNGSMPYVEYERQVLGMEVPFFATHRDARILMEREAPDDAVLIPFYLHVRYEERYIEPHPDCDAPHEKQTPKKVSVITCEAFPSVLPEHRAAVESFGIKNRVVRIPVRPVRLVEELTHEAAP